MNNPFPVDLRKALEQCDTLLTVDINSDAAVSAARSILKVLDLDQNDPLFIAIQAHLLFRQEKYDEAIELAQKASQLEPNNPARLKQLASMYFELDQNPKAPVDLNCGLNYVLALRYLRNIVPEDASIHISIVEKLQYLEQHHWALEDCKIWLRTIPDDALAYLYAGNSLGALDETQDALDCWEKARTMDHKIGLVWRRIAESHPEVLNDRDIQVIEYELSRNPEVTDRIEFHHALGYIYDSKQQYDRAFEQFKIGKDLANQTFFRGPYDHQRAVESTEKVIKGVRVAPGTSLRIPTESPRPIFIVGLPRSGTTLVQQILATHTNSTGHPDVYVAGEVPQMHKAFQVAKYRCAHPSANPEEEYQFGAELHVAYRKSVFHLFGFDRFEHCRYFIDKSPLNFHQLELILQIFPDSPIIHCTRDPRDCAISTFKRNYGPQPDMQVFNDLGDFARHYRDAYRPLMQHWNSILPTGKILEVSYEKLVTDPVNTIPEILAYCDLPRSDSCLKHHEFHGIVNSTEVRARQPIDTNSIGRWRNYEKHFDKFFAELPELR